MEEASENEAVEEANEQLLTLEQLRLLKFSCRTLLSRSTCSISTSMILSFSTSSSRSTGPDARAGTLDFVFLGLCWEDAGKAASVVVHCAFVGFFEAFFTSETAGSVLALGLCRKDRTTCGKYVCRKRLMSKSAPGNNFSII